MPTPNTPPPQPDQSTDPARLLDARGLCRDYAGTRVVHDAALELSAGDVLGVLGPNGAGKTTMLRMLAGTLAPSAGQVTVGGVDMARAPIAAKRQIGYLPERPPLYNELTVNEYLMFCARLQGLPRRERRAAVAAAKSDCELTEVGQRPIGHLSKGFQQRVGIAQAILPRPAVLILDEPTAGLDPNQLRGVRDLIARLATSHSVIVASHILPEIQAVATRVMIINAGRIALDSPMTELDGGSTRLEVGFRNDPGAAALEALTPAASLTPLGAGRWQIAADNETAMGDLRVALAQASAHYGWQLDLMMPRRVTLEDYFTRLTSGDAAEQQDRPA